MRVPTTQWMVCFSIILFYVPNVCSRQMIPKGYTTSTMKNKNEFVNGEYFILDDTSHSNNRSMFGILDKLSFLSIKKKGLFLFNVTDSYNWDYIVNMIAIMIVQ